MMDDFGFESDIHWHQFWISMSTYGFGYYLDSEDWMIDT